MPNRQLASAGVALLLVLASPLRAEFVLIEAAADQAAELATPHLKGKTAVVAARPVDRTPQPWAYDEAVAVELTAALQERGIDAVRAASHPATEALGRPVGLFKAADARRIADADRDVLVAIEIGIVRRVPTGRVTLWEADGRKLEEFRFELPADSLQIAANVPDLNRSVVEFCRQNLGAPVGDGICATLGGDALKAAGAERTSIYTWGRELDAEEQILPGDILQLEKVEMKGPGFSRKFEHHTVVVEEVRPDGIAILQQNVLPAGKVVHRDVWPAAAARIGFVHAYRPWTGESPLPPVSPRRREPADVVQMGRTVDLLRTLDPQLDSIRGIWWNEPTGLRWNRDTFARLQVPYVPPESYTLRLKFRRLVGEDQFGIGLIVGGRQVLLAIDGFQGQKSGLHLLDGKKCNANETTFTGHVLPTDKLVELVVIVRPDSVVLTVDGDKIVDWTGDPARLSMDERYSVPDTTCLFLASWNVHAELSEFTLTEE